MNYIYSLEEGNFILMLKDSCKFIPLLVQIIFEKKGTRIAAFDVRGISSATDYVLIANGNVERHVLALADEIEMKLKQIGILLHRSEGRGSSGWIVLDYFDLIIHLCIPSMRQKYQLDDLWSDGKTIDINGALPLLQVTHIS